MKLGKAVMDFHNSLGAPEFCRLRLGFHPDRHQCLVLDPSIQRGILNCTRQWGKSTVTAAKAIHHAVTVAGSLTLVASPSARQSGEFLRKAETFARKLKLDPRGDGDNAISLLLPNNSRIVGIPANEDTTRGFSAVTLMLIDEASRVPDSFYYSLLPTMITRADAALWLMSTPNGKQGFFYNEWIGEEDWTRIEVPATDCPRIPQKSLDRERRHMTKAMFEQEYLCKFIAPDNSFFDADMVREASERDPEPFFS